MNVFFSALRRMQASHIVALSSFIVCSLLAAPVYADVKVDVDVKADSVLDAVEAQMPDMFDEDFCSLGGETQPDCATSAIHMAKVMVKMSGIAKGAWDSFKITIDIAQDVADLYGFGLASFGAEMVMNALDAGSPGDFLKNSGQTLTKSLVGAAASASASKTAKWNEVLDYSFTDEAVNTVGEKFLSKAAGKLYDKILEELETGVTDRTYGAGFWGSKFLNLLDIPDPTTHPCGPVTMTFWISRGGDTGLQYNMSISGDCKCESGRPLKMRAFNVYVTIPLQRTLRLENDTVKMEVRPAGHGRYHATADCNCTGEQPADGTGTGLAPDDGDIGFIPSDGFTTADYICVFNRGCLRDREQYDFHQQQAERAQARADAERANAERDRAAAEELRKQIADGRKSYEESKARLGQLTPPTDANLQSHGATLQDYRAAQDAVRNYEELSGRREAEKQQKEAENKDSSAAIADRAARQEQAKANDHRAQAEYFWAKYQDCLRRCIRDACAVGESFGTGRRSDMIWSPGYGAEQVQRDLHELIDKMKKEGLQCRPFGLGGSSKGFGYLPGTSQTIAYTPGNFGALQLASDSPNWCEYRPGNPVSTPVVPTGTDPGDGPIEGPGDDPRDTPDGGRPRDGERDESGGVLIGGEPRKGSGGGASGDDPRDLPGDDGGDDPRDAGVPCERWIASLLRHRDDLASQLEKLVNTDGSSEDLIERLAGQVRQIDEEVAHRRQDCPIGPAPEDADDPRDLPIPPGSGARDAPVADGGDPGSTPADDGDDPRDRPTVWVVVKAKRQVLAGDGKQVTETVAGENIKLAMPSQLATAVPVPGAPKDEDTDHDEDPVQGRTDAKGELALDVPVGILSPEARTWLKNGCGSLKCVRDAASRYSSSGADNQPVLQTDIDATTKASRNLKVIGGQNDPVVQGVITKFGKHVSDINSIGQHTFVTLTYDRDVEEQLLEKIRQTANISGVQVNYCRIKEQVPNDPLYLGKGAWGQDYDNQWALKHVGLTAGGDSAWNMLGDSPSPVVVAVIDTGLDWNHLDFDWNNLWRNQREIPGNGVDDDHNGYTDDIVGWDFFEKDNTPWDLDGHGSITAGIIAAHTNNGIGMAGINPHARIMVLRALNSFGNTRASFLAKAIVYAVDNGARIINLSVGGPEISEIETAAVEYAESKGVLLVVAAGNQGEQVDNYGVASHDAVITVAATDRQDKRAVFSNWGGDVDLAAPGMDILGLRARRTDTMRDMPDVDYEPGTAYVGTDKRYYRVGGTSFAAPIVTGIASLRLSKTPDLTASQLRNILLQSARDIEKPGKDNLTGYGLVDARAVLSADPSFFIMAEITGVAVVQDDGKVVVSVQGSADALKFKRAVLELGAGEVPAVWKDAGVVVHQAVKAGELGHIDAGMFAGSAVWIVRLTVEDEDGRQRVFWYKLNIG